MKQARVFLLLFIVFGMVFLPVSTFGYSERNRLFEVADSSDFGNVKPISPRSTVNGNWNFSRMTEWGNFACVDDDSVELVVGINNTRLGNYAELVNLATEKGGTIVNDIRMGEECEAVVVDLPFSAVSPFVDEVQKANLSSYVEPNLKFHVDFVPNDIEWAKQWGPKKIEADYAWNTTTGNRSILVAVIDTGVDYNHPDLTKNYVALGYDWVNNDTYPMDDNSHGTHCAGIIAAETNNSIGIAGIAQVSIMAEKAFNSSGDGLEDDVANAIIHAVDQGADILSNSWGDYEESQLIRNAMNYAYAHGLLIVAAAGNEATSNMLYPAAYDEVIAVTATTSTDVKASFSNYGDWVELAAPGVDIYSTVLNGQYESKQGTSMACPHVAGVAALIWSRFPNLSRDWVRAQLRSTSDDLGDAGFDQYYGYGRVNARKAIADITYPIVSITSPVQGSAVASTNVTVNWIGVDNETGIDHYSVYLNETLVGNTTANSYNVSNLSEGLNNITVVAYDKEGNNASDRISIFVDLNPPNIKIISPLNGYATNVGNITVEWIGSDNETEIAYYLVYLDNIQAANTTNTEYVFTDFIEGHHTIKIEAYDHAGNMQGDEVAVIVDNTDPELSVISPENGTFVADHVTVQFSVFDANLLNVEYQINNGTPVGVTGETNFTIYTGSLADGAFNITITAMDKALNTVNQTLTLIADNTAPTVSISSPQQGAELLGTTTISFAAADANLEEVHLYIDTGEINITGTTVYSWSTTTVGDGVHTIRLVATDKAGNTAEASVTVITVNLRRSIEDARNFFFILGLVAGAIIGTITVYFARRQKHSP